MSKSNSYQQQIEDKLNTYDFPNRFIVKYAVAVAITVKQYMKDEASLKALDLADRYSRGEEVGEQTLKNAAYAAANTAARAATYAATNAAYATSYAAHTAYAAANAATYAATYAAVYATSYAAYAAHAAANTATNKSYNKSMQEYLELLDIMINNEYTEFELMMMSRNKVG